MKPRLIVEQKITAFVNQYRIYSADQEGNKQEMIGFAQQKRLAFKEKVSFYTDEKKENLAFTMRAEKVFDVHGRYFIEDDKGNIIGAFKKEFSKSLLLSTWSILNKKESVVFTVAENNLVLALTRRFGGFLPIIGDIVDLVVLFFRYHFNFADNGNEVVGQYKKTTLFRDHYLLSMTDEAYAQEDPRVLAAFAVALDALQSR